jgi:hypothetical protein
MVIPQIRGAGGLIFILVISVTDYFEAVNQTGSGKHPDAFAPGCYDNVILGGGPDKSKRCRAGEQTGHPGIAR